MKTQIPYALTAGIFAILLGFLPAGMGIINAVVLGAGAVAIVIWVYTVGKVWPEKLTTKDTPQQH